MDRSPDDEQDLLRRVVQGDVQAFSGLVQRHADSLFGLGYSLTGNAADAEDVVQETFLASFRGLRRFEARSSVKTWLYRILVRQVARHHRARYRRPAATLDLAIAAGREPVQPEATEAQDMRLDLTDVLKKLTAEHRHVVVLRELQGLSYAKIAEILDLPRGTVESRLHRARESLRQQLKDYIDYLTT